MNEVIQQFGDLFKRSTQNIIANIEDIDAILNNRDLDADLNRRSRFSNRNISMFPREKVRGIFIVMVK